MLDLLHIENIAVIEEADIRFRPGFNALTGETGAGKSIVIDAMGAVLGGRTSRELIRTGADRAFVSACFSNLPADLPGLAACGVSPDENGELLLQREIYEDGKNACRANGRPVTVAQLRQIGGELLNIHGQHDGAQLLDEERHCAYLDRFGRTDAPLESYRAAYGVMADLAAKMAALRMDEAEKARRMDSLRFQIGELERAELTPGEEEALLERRELLRNGEKYLSALSGADYALSGDDEGGGAVTALREAEAAMASVRNLGGDLAELYKRLEEARCEVYDLAETIRDKRAEFDFSPAELDAVESRTDLLYRLEKKYGATVEECIAYLDRCREEPGRHGDGGRHPAGWKSSTPRRSRRYPAGATLTEARRQAAAALEERIQSELRDLDMRRVRFAHRVHAPSAGARRLRRHPLFDVRQRGEDLRPHRQDCLRRRRLADHAGAEECAGGAGVRGDLVFDEVDTGVSGRAAQKVAEAGPGQPPRSRCCA